MSKIMFFAGAGLVLMAIALLIFFMTHPLSYKSLLGDKRKIKTNNRKKRIPVKMEEERATQLLRETKPLDSDFERQTVLLADYEESDE